MKLDAALKYAAFPLWGREPVAVLTGEVLFSTESA
jgi:hypothetical protein